MAVWEITVGNWEIGYSQIKLCHRSIFNDHDARFRECKNPQFVWKFINYCWKQRQDLDNYDSGAASCAVRISDVHCWSVRCDLCNTVVLKGLCDLIYSQCLWYPIDSRILTYWNAKWFCHRTVSVNRRKRVLDKTSYGPCDKINRS
jgi:hypothetical protein